MTLYHWIQIGIRIETKADPQYCTRRVLINHISINIKLHLKQIIT